MGPLEWITFASLMFTILTSVIVVSAKSANNKNEILDKINITKDDLDNELTAIRMAAYEEYKILRREMAESSNLAYREFGESLRAIREKTNQIEIWFRDELAKTRLAIINSTDIKCQEIKDNIDDLEDRVRKVEINIGP